MDRTGAAEREQGELLDVLAALDRVDACRGRHVLVDQLVNPPGRAHRLEAERPADPRFDRARRGRGIEAHLAAEKELRVEIAEHQIGIGHGRLVAALPVAGRARIGAGAVRPDLEQPEAVDPGDAAAAGADLDHLDHRHLDRQAAALLEAVLAVDLEICRDQGFAMLDQAGLGGGAAHVEREQARAVDQPAVVGGGERAGGRAGLDQAHGEAAGGLDVAHAAVRLHDEQGALDADRAQALLEAPQITPGEALHVDVGERGRGPLVLADLRDHLAGQRAADLRGVRAQQLADRPLVRRVAVAVQEAHGDRLDLLRAQGRDQAQHLVRVEGLHRRCRPTSTRSFSSKRRWRGASGVGSSMNRSYMS